MRCHDNDHGLRRELTDVLQHREPVRSRHHQIGQHDVEIELIDLGDPFIAVGRLVDIVALAA